MAKKEESTLMSKIIIPLIAAILLGAFVSPLGDQLREMVFPTSAFVEGIVQRQGKAQSNLKVVLDEKKSALTTVSGGFSFDQVSSGTHSLRVFQNDILQFDHRFAVKPGDKTISLGTIQVDAAQETGQSSGTPAAPVLGLPTPAVPGKQPTVSPLNNAVQLTHQAVSIPPDQRRPDFPTNTNSITVWVLASDQSLNQITQVTYFLGEGFNPSVVSRFSPLDRFALSFTAQVPFLLQARIYFSDGSTRDVSRYITF